MSKRTLKSIALIASFFLLIIGVRSQDKPKSKEEAGPFFAALELEAGLPQGLVRAGHSRLKAIGGTVISLHENFYLIRSNRLIQSREIHTAYSEAKGLIGLPLEASYRKRAQALDPVILSWDQMARGVSKPQSISVYSTSMSAPLLAQTDGMHSSSGKIAVQGTEGAGSIIGMVTNASGVGIVNAKWKCYDLYESEVNSGSTSSGGSYTISDLAAGSYKLLFWANMANNCAPEWYNNRTSFETADVIFVEEGSATTGIDVQLEAGGIVSGTVIDDSGNPIENAFVAVEHTDWPISGTYIQYFYEYTDASGAYRIQGLPSMDTQVWFDGSEAGSYFSEYYDNKADRESADLVAVTAGATTSGINARLSSGGLIAGTVTNGSGEGVANVWVYAYTASGDYVNYGISDSSGAYQIQALQPGSYKVEFDPRGLLENYAQEYYDDKSSFTLAEIVTVTAGNPANGIDAQLEPGGTIKGSVINGAGAGLANAFVTAYPIQWDPMDRNLPSGITGLSGGAYQIRGLRTGSYKVHFAEHIADYDEGYLPEWFSDKTDFASADPVSVTEGNETSDINAQLTLGGTIYGRVYAEVSGTGAGIAGVGIDVYDLSNDLIVTDATDSEGDFIVNHTFVPGSYKIRLDAHRAGDEYISEWYSDKADFEHADAISVTAGSGTNVVAGLASGGTIVGKITNASGVGIEGIQAAIYGLNYSDAGDGVTDAGGNYTVSGLPSGGYKVLFLNNGQSFLSEWYNDKSDFETADQVTVNVGSTTPDINAQLEAGTSNPITVTSPNGGESWAAGSIQEVTWAQAGLTGDVTIDLYKGGAFDSTIGIAPVLDRTYSWPIPAGQAAGNNYKVRIHQGGAEDFSNSNFSISIPSPIISSCTPSSGTIGTVVSIQGSHFGTAIGSVTFNGLPAIIKYWSDIEVRAEVPVGATSGQILLATSTGKVSNGIGFSIETPSGVTVSIDSLPDPIQSGQLFDVEWAIRGGTTVNLTKVLYYDDGGRGGSLTGNGISPGAFAKRGTINVTSDTVYHFKAYAVVDSWSYFSAETTRLVKAPVLPKPDALTSVQIDAANTTSSKLRLTWSHPNPTIVDGYYLKYKESSASTWQRDSCPSGVYAYTFVGLLAGTSYDFLICAYNASGSSSDIAISGSTLNSPSLTPTNLHIVGTPSPNAITLAWNGTIRNGEENYHIQRRRAGESVYSNKYTTSNTYVDDVLAASTTYIYKISVSGIYGESNFTSEITATTSEKPAGILSFNYSVEQVGCEDADDNLIAEKSTIVVLKARSDSVPFTAVGKLFVDGVLDRTKSADVDPYSFTNLLFYPSANKLTPGSHDLRIEVWNGNTKVLSIPISKIFNAKKSIKVLLVPINTLSYKHKASVFFRKDYLDFLSATFPVSERDVSFVMYNGCLELSYDINDIGFLGFGIAPSTQAMFDLWKYIASIASSYDQIVGVVPAYSIMMESGKNTYGYTKYVNGLLGRHLSIIQDDTSNAYKHTKHTLAHEIGHVYGLYNGLFEKEMYDKSDYPGNYKVGKDCWSGWLNYGLIDVNRVDLMGNWGDGRSWVIKSTYDYLKDELVASSLIRSSEGSGGMHVSLAGWIDRIRNVAFNIQAYTSSSAENYNGSGSGEYSIILSDKSGNSLSEYKYQPSFQARLGSSNELDQVPFFFTVPLPDGANKIEVMHNSSPIGAIYASPSSPEVVIELPVGGELIGTTLIKWSGSDADGDSLKYNLYYSADNGFSWYPLASLLEEPSFLWDSSNYPGTTLGKIKVEASDSFNTTAVLSNGNFTIGQKSPRVGINFPHEGSLLLSDTPYQLSANGDDPEDGIIPDAKYSWMSDKDGDLGIGAQIEIDCLSEGNHVISVQVMDSEGNTATQYANAQVVKGYRLSVDVAPLSGGTIEITPKNDSYPPNSRVTLMANPEAGYQFVGWEGDISSTENPLLVTMDMNKTITAKFSSGSQVLSVTSPKGGESWIGGSIHDITWTATETVENVKLEYSTDGGATYIPVIAATANTGTYEWTVPDTPSTTCLVKASDAANETLNDVSDNVFSILAAPPGLTVTSPNGGEYWGKGSANIITWTYTGDIGAKVKIQLYQGTALKKTLTLGTPTANRSFVWKIPATMTLGTTYKIRITSTTNKAYADDSNAPFNIVAESIMVTSPNGGDRWVAGTASPITWTYKGTLGASVKIELFKGGALNSAITLSAPLGSRGKGSFGFIVPSGQAYGNDYRVKASSSSNEGIFDISDANFMIYSGLASAWGSNDAGELGNGTLIANNFPIPVLTLSTVKALSAGRSFSAALKANGTVWTWGRNLKGQLGNGTNTDSPLPVQVSGLTGATSVAAGGSFALALLSSGKIQTWGENSKGQLGNAKFIDSNIPVFISGTVKYKAIAGGDLHAAALAANGTVMTWGSNTYGQLGNGSSGKDSNKPVKVLSLGSVTALAAGAGHTAALKKDGTVRVWGDGVYGQLGNGKNTMAKTPVQVKNLTKVAAIASGGFHMVALMSDGTVWTWGLNDKGQLGIGNNGNANLPVQVGGLRNVIAVAAGGSHTLILKSDGTVWAWGLNDNGQLGIGSNIDSNVPVQIGSLTNVVGIAGGYRHTIALH